MSEDDEMAPDAETAQPVISSFDQAPMSLSAALDTAWQHYSGGRLPQAESLYRQIIEADANQPVALHLLGLIVHQVGKNEEAAELIGRAVTLQPRYAEALHNLGIILIQLKRHDEAAARFHAATVAQPDYVEAYINMADILRQQGKMDAALVQYHKAIAVQPDHARAHYSLGLAFQDAGELETALLNYRKAVSLEPNYFEALNNMGNAYRKLGRLSEAADSFRKVLALKPDIAEIHNNLGNVLLDLKQYEEALDCYQAAATIRPIYAQAYFGMGAALKELGRPEEAMARFYKAITVDPTYVYGHYALGGMHHAAGELDEAISDYRKVIAIDPDFYEAHNDLGVAYLDLGRNEEALACLQMALALNSENPGAYNNLGNVLRVLGRHDEAIESFGKALDLKPIFPDALNNLGNVYKNRRQPEEATKCYQKALDFDPSHVGALNHMGLVQMTLGNAQAAIECHEKAIELQPENPQSFWGLSNALLMAEDFDRGLELYDWRWKVDFDTAQKWRPFPQPVWGGADLSGKRLLIWGEQGIGEEILFASMFSDVCEMADTVVVECLQRLHALFSRSFPDIEFIVRQDPPQEMLNSPDIDFQIAAGSLGQHLRKNIASFPARDRYLVADADRQADIRSGYKSRFGNKPLVGLAWHSGNSAVGAARSLTLAQLLPLLSDQDCQFINLQYGDVTEDLTVFKETSSVEVFIDETIDPLTDIDAFSAQVAALDLVITIDNSTAHLAGALGVPAWVLLPYDSNWYWSRNNDASRWYPSTHLYRQQMFDQWSDVIERVTEDLGQQIKNGF